jgi:hypothetical protein
MGPLSISILNSRSARFDVGDGKNLGGLFDSSQSATMSLK